MLFNVLDFVQFVKDNKIALIAAAVAVLFLLAIIGLEAGRKKCDKKTKAVNAETAGAVSDNKNENSETSDENSADDKTIADGKSANNEETEGQVKKESAPKNEKPAETVSPAKEVTPIEAVSKPIKEEKPVVAVAPIKEEKPVVAVATVKDETAEIKKQSVKDADIKNSTGKKAVGKWVVKEKGDSEYVSYLYANNGEVLLTSEIYVSADGAKKGIETIKKSIKNDAFQIYSDKNDHYYFKLKNSTNRFLCVGEIYPSKISCQNVILSVKRFSEDAPIQDAVVEEITQIKYIPKADDADVNISYKGKWKIRECDGMFIAELFASNGELLLASEYYSSFVSAKNIITVIKTNGLKNNFIIDSDKNGRYFFKLRNAQKYTLCVGEAYESLISCQSAVDSVVRFLKTAELS